MRKLLSATILLVAITKPVAGWADVVTIPAPKPPGSAGVPPHASIVGGHRDITTSITLIGGGFHVKSRFSQGDRLHGTHMCAAVNFRDKKGKIVGQVRQRVGQNATRGGHTQVDYKDSDIVLKKDDLSRLETFEIGQKECPIPYKWWETTIETVANLVVTVITGG